MEFKVKRTNELCHHGTLGMKWGVWNDETAARYGGVRKRVGSGVKKVSNAVATGALQGVQNASQEATKMTVNRLKEKYLTEKNVAIAKKVAVGLGALTVAAAAVYLTKNPSAAVKAAAIVNKYGKVALGAFKEGLKDGIVQGPRALGKAVVYGSALVVGKQFLDLLLGQEKSDAIFKANDKDKVPRFWVKGQPA